MQLFLVIIALITFSSSAILYASPNEITVYYFVVEGCTHCDSVENYIDGIRPKYPEVVFKRFDLFENGTNIDILISIMKSFGLGETFPNLPVLFVGETYLVGENNITASLEAILLQYATGALEYNDKAGEVIRNIANNVTELDNILPRIISVITMAFVDSLNPCAFATIILLITYSLSIGSSNKMLMICGSFILGVLASYLIIGITLLQVLGFFAEYRVAIRYFIGLITIFLGILEFKEAFLYGKWFSLEKPGIINTFLNKYSYSMNAGAGLLMGMAVSAVEFSCTGVAYVPTLYLISKTSPFLECLLLLIYNIIFVLPLIAILILTYLGRRLVEIDSWRIEKRRYLRLIMGIVLLIIGVAIIIGLI
ncbi:MAG: cytochrome c biogenesis CcdA family protein [Thermoproteota archaeon]